MVKKILLGLLSLFILSCSLFNEPLDPELIHKKKDKTPPIFSIISPTSDTLFEESVTVNGKVDKEEGELSKVVWSVSDNLTELTSGTVDKKGIAKDGSFSFNFSTVGFSSDIVITVTVFDWNNNRSSQEIKLRYSGTFIPSFKVEAGNQKVDLYWNEIEGVENYTIYFTDNGGLPSEFYHTDLRTYTKAPTKKSPLTIDKLENGKVYRFLIKATDNNDTNLYSMVLDSVPQSTKTFVPTLVSEGNKVKLTWFSNADSLKYNVLRSDHEDGQYSNISGDITKNEFIDSNVYSDKTYFYRIKPVIDGSIYSNPVGIHHVEVKLSDSDVQLDYDLSGQTHDIKVVGDKAYIAAGPSGFQVFDLVSKKLIYTLPARRFANSIEIYGDYAYLLDQGLSVIQISGVSSEPLPRVISYFNEDEIGYKDIAVHNSSYALLGTSSSIRVIDIRDKSSLSFVDEYIFTGYSLTNIESDGNYGYVTLRKYESGEYSYDLRRILLSSYGIPTSGANYQVTINAEYNPQAFQNKGDYLYTGGKNNFTIFHKNKTGTDYESTLPLNGVINSVTVSGNLAYIIVDTYTLNIIDIKDVTALNPGKIILSRNLYEEYNSLTTYKNGALLGKKSGGLLKIGKSSISDIKETSFTFKNDSSIYTNGNKLYIQGEKDFTELTYINNTLSATLNHTLPFEINKGQNKSTTLYNNLYYITGSILSVLNINETSTNFSLADQRVHSILSRSGDYLFIQEGKAGAAIIDISDKTNLNKTSTIPYDGNYTGIVCKGNFFYAIDYFRNYFITFSIEDIKKPVAISSSNLTTYRQPNSICIVGNVVGVGQEYGQVEFFDISDPGKPSKIATKGSGDTSDPKNRIKVLGLGSKYVIAVNTLGNTLDIYEITGNSVKYAVKDKSIPGIGEDFTVLGNRIYFLDDNDYILKYVEIELD